MTKEIKAYKAFDRKMTCLNQIFKEGETYEIDEKPVLCERGFHFCKDLVLTLQFYPVNKYITENYYAEVEVMGDVEWELPTKHKGVTNKIKILRVLSDKEVKDMIDNNWNSGDRNSGNRNSGDRNSGNWNSGYCNSGDRNSGNCNSGDCNSGGSNSGDWNSGYCNSGDRNSGNWNSGYCNSGDRNSGNWNSGDWNSGGSNSGDWNSGNWNSGDRNSGDWNSCSFESGALNSTESDTVRIFNKNCDRLVWDNAYKPDFLYFDIDNNIGYKASFKQSWNKSDPADRERVRELPNFNADVFFDISGIDLKRSTE